MTGRAVRLLYTHIVVLSHTASPGVSSPSRFLAYECRSHTYVSREDAEPRTNHGPGARHRLPRQEAPAHPKGTRATSH
ncbi:hypothetical protein COLINT_03218 [Collinsella intestinalis DSM 13280]|uniref:Uncharacterized protein n=1 Tax=Collinsella intestinalis DSM 13280 TaxID=521003 RepID=C4FAX1_9ACTN|nr:hypothetical protein COLINT_03218 [Collinsella intestinalis DSM 13280]